MNQPSPQPRALILAPFSPDVLDSLRSDIVVDYESWLDTRKLYDPAELAARLTSEGISVLVVEADFVFEEVFEAASTLKFLGVCRGSTDHVDVDAATQHGVLVVNTPGRNARAVAEHALGLMLSLARRIPHAHRYMVDGRWRDPVEPYASMRGVELAGRTLGIIGLGAAGSALAEIGVALRMAVVAYDPYQTSAPDSVSLTELEALLRVSDFVAIHAPLTSDTEGLLDAARLALMRPSAYLVNLSAASIVVEDALVEALRQRRIAGAAFDVFETHPLASDSPLLSLDNMVFTPHLGGATQETVQRHSEMMAGDIGHFLSGNRPRNLVNPEVWERLG